MHRQLLTGAVLILLAGCGADRREASNTSEDIAIVANAQVAGEMIFCREINRRTTRQDCDDLTETAAQAKNGTAAFNVPTMTRGKATMIELAISLEPPPMEDPGSGGETLVENASDNASAPENASATLETPTPSPVPSPSTARPSFKGPAPAEVVDDLPGRTEKYSPLVGRDMRAELIGQGFKIEPKSPASQVLQPGSTTSWEWEVTPLRGSDYALAVKTAVEGVMANGERVVLGSTVETRTVDVKVRWYDRVRDGLTEAPTWIKLVTGVLLALAALFAAWWKLVRSAKGEKVAEEKDPGEKKPD
jgi:hypothetical protein